MDVAIKMEYHATEQVASAETIVQSLESQILAAAFQLRQQRLLVEKNTARARAMAKLRMAMRQHFLKRYATD